RPPQPQRPSAVSTMLQANFRETIPSSCSIERSGGARGHRRGPCNAPRSASARRHRATVVSAGTRSGRVRPRDPTRLLRAPPLAPAVCRRRTRCSHPSDPPTAAAIALEDSRKLSRRQHCAATGFEAHRNEIAALCAAEMPDLSVEEVKKEIDAKLAYLQRK